MDRRLTSTWWILKIALGAVPFLAGLDKFFNLLTNWTDYLNPRALELVPVSAEVFMWGVGIIEMIIGLLILTRWTKLGAYLAACWLVAIAVNLVAMEKFYDLAVRNVLTAAAAFALARLTAVRQAERAPAGRAPADPATWEPSPSGILRLNL
jgi:uncharacterized membrane protein YphA (DoxX/SURF4 family)